MATLDFRKVMTPTIIVLALGYMVDAFDLLLFNVIRVPSLTELGYSGDALTKAGIYIINWQMVGMMVGGILFGVLGDKIGRKNAVLGSILLYSVATLLLTFSPEIAKAKGIVEPVKASFALMLGLGLGAVADIIGTVLCQIRKNRKEVLGYFMAVNFIIALVYLYAPYTSVTIFYILCALLGLSNFFVLTLMMTAEQFGTNVRATASTSSLSAGRGTVILSNMIFVWLKPFGTVEALGIMTIALFAIGFLCLSQLKESFHREMDFTE